MLLELLDISGEIPCVDYKHIQNSEVSREFTSRIKQNKNTQTTIKNTMNLTLHLDSSVCGIFNCSKQVVIFGVKWYSEGTIYDSPWKEGIKKTNHSKQSNKMK